jgi:hypothetical protein
MSRAVAGKQGKIGGQRGRRETGQERAGRAGARRQGSDDGPGEGLTHRDVGRLQPHTVR